ncbi:lactate dehydrogenase-like 2-hydroxyacid dehydrogenase [Mesorhizobium soli]|jgi:lactate dehydrogenase-like 2-hydroxyacid dehydrogenase|uniref:2-hydroxyacid dehydrogenase n=1 Tax=Pseudaminobacter soli (ex Li et al. 2025) TaxID=1295366 RepID=UPI002473E38F|nr:2-hydroxyacid dehydrogenase [Mesorhizobium soli]MDH6233626.1 lactate dehydrogenase-like 2-hydroxyacid dehydrogenase [Mesorhizobium soli]
MTEKRPVTILVPGRLHERSVQRIDQTFRMVRIDHVQPDLLTPEMKRDVRGVAAMGFLEPLGAAFIDALPNLEIIASFGVGYDAIDAAYAGSKDVVVTNTPDVLTEEVADTALGLLLNTVRELPRAEAYLRAGRWEKEGNYPLTPMTLRGRRAGIFGMGRIGMAIAKRLETFGLSIAYHNRRPVEGLAYPCYPSLEELAESVDTLISVVPGGAATEKIVNARIFKALGADGVFINIGRGSTVDEDALVEALRDGTIRAAGLDVFAEEPHVPQGLIDLPNAVLLPHVGSASVHTRNAMADLVVDNLISWFSDGNALTPVAETAHVAAKPRT